VALTPVPGVSVSGNNSSSHSASEIAQSDVYDDVGDVIGATNPTSSVYCGLKQSSRDRAVLQSQDYQQILSLQTATSASDSDVTDQPVYLEIIADDESSGAREEIAKICRCH